MIKLFTFIHNRYVLAFGCLDIFVSIITKLRLRILGCKIGKNVKFIGFPHIDRITVNSHISIGDNCKFRSRRMSNPLGLVRPCIFALSSSSGCFPKLSIGDDCGFSGVSLWCFSSIHIGNGVRVGANTIIIDGDAHFDDPRTSAAEPIVIENNVFIGANCIIKKGVTIGRNSVIGMGSIVTKSIPANSIAAGVPCKVIRYLTEEIKDRMEEYKTLNK